MEEQELHQSKLLADSLIKQFGERARPVVESVMQVARRLYAAEAERDRLKAELQAALDHARAMEEARNVESLEAKRLYYMLKDIQGKCISAGASATDYSARGETRNALYLALDTLRRIAEGTQGASNELIR